MQCGYCGDWCSRVEFSWLVVLLLRSLYLSSPNLTTVFLFLGAVNFSSPTVSLTESPFRDEVPIIISAFTQKLFLPTPKTLSASAMTIHNKTPPPHPLPPNWSLLLVPPEVLVCKHYIHHDIHSFIFPSFSRVFISFSIFINLYTKY